MSPCGCRRRALDDVGRDHRPAANPRGERPNHEAALTEVVSGSDGPMEDLCRLSAREWPLVEMGNGHCSASVDALAQRSIWDGGYGSR